MTIVLLVLVVWAVWVTVTIFTFAIMLSDLSKRVGR